MRTRREHKHALLLLGVVAGMFGFAFALVPLYEVFCDITGLNGRTSARASSVAELQDAVPVVDREVTIQFLAKTTRGLPWEFRPTKSRLRVPVGTMQTATYFARNRADQPVTAQAVPSVSPGRAAPYLKKIECFCFTRQTLDGDSAAEMPVTFVVAADLPPEIRELSLSYTIFPVEVPAAQQTGGAQ